MLEFWQNYIDEVHSRKLMVTCENHHISTWLVDKVPAILSWFPLLGNRGGSNSSSCRHGHSDEPLLFKVFLDVVQDFLPQTPLDTSSLVGCTDVELSGIASFLVDLIILAPSRNFTRPPDQIIFELRAFVFFLDLSCDNISNSSQEFCAKVQLWKGRWAGVSFSPSICGIKNRIPAKLIVVKYFKALAKRTRKSTQVNGSFRLAFRLAIH